MNFKTTLQHGDITIYGIIKKAKLARLTNFDTDAVIMIDWDVSIETRDWGIKSIDAVINTIAGTVTVTEWDVDKQHLIDIAGMEIINDVEVEKGTICITDATIDFDMNTITLRG